eukprot:COSAG02_NODE_7297_length_3079_cov_153.433221_5_plen_76_part_00
MYILLICRESGRVRRLTWYQPGHSGVWIWIILIMSRVWNWLRKLSGTWWGAAGKRGQIVYTKIPCSACMNSFRIE